MLWCSRKKVSATQCSLSLWDNSTNFRKTLHSLWMHTRHRQQRFHSHLLSVGLDKRIVCYDVVGKRYVLPSDMLLTSVGLDKRLVCYNLCNRAFQSEEIISFHASSNTGHYQSTMTSHNDSRTWYHERRVRFLLKRQTSAHITPCTRAFITLRDDRHVWTDQSSLTGIDRHWVKHKLSKVFLYKLHLKCIQNVQIVVINDNNNFAPSLFWSLCEFVGDCFGYRYFSLGAALRKIPWSKTIASDFTKWPQNRWWAVIVCK